MKVVGIKAGLAVLVPVLLALSAHAIAGVYLHVLHAITVALH